MIPRWKNVDPDVLAEALAVLHREAEAEEIADEIANEQADRDASARGERDQDWRV